MALMEAYLRSTHLQTGRQPWYGTTSTKTMFHITSFTMQDFPVLAASHAREQSCKARTPEQEDGGGKMLHKKSAASTLTLRKRNISYGHASMCLCMFLYMCRSESERVMKHV